MAVRLRRGGKSFPARPGLEDGNKGRGVSPPGPEISR